MDFSSVNPDAINDILSSLSAEDMEKLSDMASQMFSFSENGNSENKSTNTGNSFSLDGIPFDTESMMKIMNLINRLRNQPDDNRIKLLYALRPMLTEKRQVKIDHAVQMLRIMAILPLLKE